MLLEGNNPFYEFSLKLWEGLARDFNYTAMVSQRGMLNLVHSDSQRDAYARKGNGMRSHGVDAERLDREQVRRKAPYLTFDHARFPTPQTELKVRPSENRAPERPEMSTGGSCPAITAASDSPIAGAILKPWPLPPKQE